MITKYETELKNHVTFWSQLVVMLLIFASMFIVCKTTTAQELTPRQGQAIQSASIANGPRPSPPHRIMDLPGERNGNEYDSSDSKNSNPLSNHQGLSTLPKPAGQQQFSTVLNRIATSTVVVLAVCVAGLLLLKRFGFTTTFASRSSKISPQAKTNPIETAVLESSIRLGGSRRLEIVSIGKTRLAVGSDSGGIKSIVPLMASFNSHLDECQSLLNETATDDLDDVHDIDKQNQSTELIANDIDKTQKTLLSTEFAKLFKFARRHNG